LHRIPDLDRHDVRREPVSVLDRQGASERSGKPAGGRRRRKLSPFWLKQLHSWHWISAAVSLIGMMLFAVTGLTLNHAGSISAEPATVMRDAMLPQPLLEGLGQVPSGNAPLPSAVAAEVDDLVGLDPAGRPAEWSDDEVYVALPGPGSDAWVSIDRRTGAIASEYTDRGWVSYFNDLHKGRNTGSAWFWFIDVFAVACVVFTLTGLVLLQIHARHRPSTWPLVAAGMALPALIAIFLIH
jgi:hypothetical protein